MLQDGRCRSWPLFAYSLRLSADTRLHIENEDRVWVSGKMKLSISQEIEKAAEGDNKTDYGKMDNGKGKEKRIVWSVSQLLEYIDWAQRS